MKSNRIIGSVLALALGDAFGASYEGGDFRAGALGCYWEAGWEAALDG